MTIDFNQIPATLLVPGVYGEMDETKASSGAPLQTYRALILAVRCRLDGRADGPEVPRA